MSRWQELVACGLCWCGLAVAESPQESTRRAMEASVARQKQALVSMQISVEKQRAALGGARVNETPGSLAAPEDSALAAAAGSGTLKPPPGAFFTLSWPALGPGCDPLPEIELTPLIQRAAQHEGIDAGLLRAVAGQESGFRPCAVSGKGAMGLMQLMPSTARDLGVRDPFDPEESLSSGAHLLKELLARFGGDMALALGAYNAGPERVEQSGGVPPIPETVHYVQQILGKILLP